MRWCWPGQGCIGSAWNITSLSGWARPSSFRRLGKGPWVSNAGAMMRLTLALLESLDDPVTRRAVLAERAALAALEGGCTLPMAAWARDIEGDESDPEFRLLRSMPPCSIPTAVLVWRLRL